MSNCIEIFNMISAETNTTTNLEEIIARYQLIFQNATHRFYHGDTPMEGVFPEIVPGLD